MPALLGLLFASALAVPGLSQATVGPPTLVVQHSQRVAVGQPIVIRLALRNAHALAGFEGRLAFDTTRARLTGVERRGAGLESIGRQVGVLGPVLRAGGAAFGFYSCPGADCTAVPGSRVRSRDGASSVELVTLLVTPEQRGTLELRLTSLRFVTRSGTSITVPATERLLAVQVAPDSARSRWRAPKPSRLTSASVHQADGAHDLTGDGLVTHADAMEVALAWNATRLSGARCGDRTHTARDVDGNGCVDVADIQSVVAAYSSTTELRTRRAALTGAEAGVLATAEPTPATWVVDSTSDDPDRSPGNGTCATRKGGCTLRAAIEEANRHVGSDVIRFNIGGGGVKTIQLSSRLPTINDETGPTTIDGYTQPGSRVNTDALTSNAAIMIQIVGAGPSGYSGLIVTSQRNTIRGVAMYSMPDHIVLTGTAANRNMIIGNFLGTNAAGTFIASSRVDRVGGVKVEANANYNRIGSAAPADRNVISGATGEGIYLAGASYNVIQGNIIGLSPDGTRQVFNRIHAIDFNYGASYNVVGGTGTGERNVLSGNLRSGVESSHGRDTVGNQVIGNYIGTDVTGRRSYSYTGNGSFGVHFEDGSSDNLAAHNVIGASREGGLVIEGYYAYGNRAEHNLIGISLDGTPIPNTGYGVRVTYHAATAIIGPGNVIAHNPVGVQVAGDPNDFVTITQNDIFANTSMAIDLAPDGPNVNDPDDRDTGPNDRLNYPVILAATPSEVRGTACSGCRVEVFAAAPAESDLGGGMYGQLRGFLGTATAGSTGSFSVAVSGIATGQLITSTATDPPGNTSEQSPNARVGTDAPTGSYSHDTFTRTVSNGWGAAEAGGGRYSLAGPAGDFSVDGSRGTIRSPVPGASRSASLASLEVRDVDLAMLITNDQLGDGLHLYLSGRRRIGGTGLNEYRGRMRLAANGAVYLRATRVIDRAETAIGPETRVPDVLHAPGSRIWLRAQIVDVAPTTVRIKAWMDGQPEPGGWQATATDSSAPLEAAGGAAVVTYLAGNATTAPLVSAIDEFTVRAPAQEPEPEPTPTPEATPTPTATPEATPTAEPLVQDTFDRTVSDGWGSANIGGAYSLGGGPLQDFDVDGGQGILRLSDAGQSRAATLPDVSVRDVDLTVTADVDQEASGGHVYLVARRIRTTSGLSEYRGRLRLAANGAVYATVARVVNGAERMLAPESLVVGLRHTDPGPISIRLEVIGVRDGVTSLRLKAWADGAAEPEWAVSVEDAAEELQAGGGIGVRAYLASNATSAPLLLRLDDLVARGATSP
ncbi:hypothetical protein BH20CHL6_BH20CHL6_06740 [soil metagenome]